MARIRTTLACLLLIGAAGAGCGLDDAIFHEGTGILSGRILNPEGTPVEGALIHFHRKAGILEPAVTDEYGQFSAAGVPAGPQPLVIRYLDPERPLGARVTGRVVGGSTTVLRDTILGDTIDVRVAAADDTHKLWDAFIQIDEVSGLEGDYLERKETRFKAIPNSGSYSLRVTRPPFVFPVIHKDASDIQDLFYLAPEYNGGSYDYGRLYCGSFEVAEIQQQAAGCSAECFMPEYPTFIPSEPPCKWPIGDRTLDDSWYLNSSISVSYLAKALDDVATTMACPEPQEVLLTCQQGNCAPRIPPEIEVKSIDDVVRRTDAMQLPPPAMTCDNVLEYFDRVALEDCEDSLYIYYENAYLELAPELVATSQISGREVDSQFHAFFLGILPLVSSRSDDPAAPSNRSGWCLNRLRFPAGYRPTPSKVHTHLAWLTTEENDFPRASQ